jgi:ketosteroid isomerase-like protein
MTFDINRYLQAFNGGDEAAFIRRFYTEDLVVEGPPGIIKGHQEWLKALTFVHDHVEEKLHPVTVMQDGDTILAEIRGVFTATADRSDFPYGPLKKGESVTVKMLAKYEVRGSRIARITLASWPLADSLK